MPQPRAGQPRRAKEALDEQFVRAQAGGHCLDVRVWDAEHLQAEGEVDLPVRMPEDALAEIEDDVELLEPAQRADDVIAHGDERGAERLGHLPGHLGHALLGRHLDGVEVFLVVPVVVVADGDPGGWRLAVGSWQLMPGRSLAANCQLPSANCRIDHPPNQLVVLDPGHPRADHDVAGDGIHARQRVDFDEVRHAVAIAADVDARHVLQPEGAPHRPPHLGHVRRVGEAVVDAVEVVALHFQRVDERLVLAPRHHLHHADRFAVDEADGELVAG